MSRNHTLRQAADKLPVMYNHEKYDTGGRSVEVDHFREMTNMRNKIRGKYPRHPNGLQRERMRHEELQIVGTYSQTVLNAHKKQRLKFIAKILQISVSVIFFTCLAIYVWMKYF